MATIERILATKGSQVISIVPDATVLDAALLMNEHGIGALVVIDSGRIAGIITERDVLRRLVAERRDPAATAVRELMTRPVVCCQADTTIEQARTLFMNRRIRHLPVVDEQGAIEGLVSIGDLNAWELDGQEQELHYLHEYIWGRA